MTFLSEKNRVSFLLRLLKGGLVLILSRRKADDECVRAFLSSIPVLAIGTHAPVYV